MLLGSVINIIYWSVCFLSAFDVEYIYEYSLEIKAVLLFCMFLIYKFYDQTRYVSCLLLIAIHIIYTAILEVTIGPIDSSNYLIQTYLFSVWSAWVLFRPEIKTAKTIDYDNILLAFYKGKQGSFIMAFFQLFGLPVKSMCIIADDRRLSLKRGKAGFVFSGSGSLLKKQDDYHIVDTGVKYTIEFISDMESYVGRPAKIFGFRVMCIHGISDLLRSIDEKFKPRYFFEEIPGLYLGKCLKL